MGLKSIMAETGHDPDRCLKSADEELHHEGEEEEEEEKRGGERRRELETEK